MHIVIFMPLYLLTNDDSALGGEPLRGVLVCQLEENQGGEDYAHGRTYTTCVVILGLVS